MKSMNNFAAQQLSKKQMNEVKGGDIECIVRWRNGKEEIIEQGLIGGANSTQEAVLAVETKYADMGFEVISVFCE